MSKKSSTKKKSISKNNSNNSAFTNKKFGGFSNLLKFFKTDLFLNRIFPIFLIFFVMWFSFSLRSGPINLDSLDQRVESGVLNQIAQMVSSQIDRDYPNINPQFKQEMVNKEILKIQESRIIDIGGQRVNLDDLISNRTAQAKNLFKDDNGQTYLNAIDPYHFLQLANNYNKNGHTGTKLIDGKPVISYKVAPEDDVFGTFKPEFHVWLESKLLKLAGADDNSPIGKQTKPIFFLPIIFAMLSVIPIFFLLRLLTKSNLISFFGSLLLVSIGTFVSRTVAGFVDTDAYQVLFSLSVVCLLIYSFFSNRLKQSLIYSILSGFFVGMFLWAWVNGWFIFVFVFISILAYFGYYVLSNFIFNKKRKASDFLREDFKLFIFNSISFFVSSFIFVYFFTGNNIFQISFNGVSKSLVGDIATISSSIWPNVLSSVAELANASFSQIVLSVGGNFVFLIAFFGLLGFSLDFKFRENVSNRINTLRRLVYLFGLIWFSLFVFNYFDFLTANSKFLFLILLFLPIGFGILLNFIFGKVSPRIFALFLISSWIAGTIYMSFNGVRFILLLAPAFAVAFGLGLYYFGSIISSFLSKEIFVDLGHKSSKKKDSEKNSSFSQISAIGMVLVSILFLLVFLPISTNAKNIGDSSFPNFDDAWYSAMYEIKNKTSDDAIITSWWDFGHFFTAVSDRGVTFDGGSQGLPQAHWVGKLFLESDVSVSKDILRMLVCGGNRAFDTFMSFTDGLDEDAVKINKILYSTFGLSRDEKFNVLLNNPYYSLNSQQVDSIMNYLACEKPRESILITSGDMVGKAGVWAHWGSWDFTKKYVLNNYKSLSVEEMALNIDENSSLIETYVSDLKKIDENSIKFNQNREDLLNRWLAPYPSYLGNFNCDLIDNNSFVSCNSVGIGFNLSSGIANLNNPNLNGNIRKVLIPNSLGFVSEFPQSEGGSGDFDFLLIRTPNSFVGILMQAPLGDSLFTKLFYLEGIGIGNNFEKLFDVNTQTSGRVILWKTNWNESSLSPSLSLDSLSVES